MPAKPQTITSQRPDRGGLTFDSEGAEGGKYHSRVLHVPGPSSGLTIGRGYDMGSKSAGEITADLVAAGVELAMAKKLSGAATLRGENAKKFIKEISLESFEISELAQKKLFETTFAAEERIARGVCERATEHGVCKWDELHPAIQELIVDLKYRGDYTVRTRKTIQPLIVANDLPGLAKAMADENTWKGVPADRFARRKAFMEAAVKAAPAAVR
jgi:Bacterial toxin homologue of phage lysozyme, C-term